MIEIILNPVEFRMAAMVGVERQISAVKEGRRDAYGAKPGEGFGLHISGAIAEYVVAKALNRAWTPQDHCDYEGDVNHLQIRSTPWQEGKLILHEEDPDHAPFILVRGQNHEWAVVGWCYGWEGKKPEFWQPQKRPAFFVPAAELSPLTPSNATEVFA